MNAVIKAVLEKLTQESFSSFVVGGFVRDYVLNQPSFDVDICTSALPTDITRIFNLSCNQFGGIHFTQGEYEFTITSLRQDVTYKNGFPQDIIFGVSLKDDSLRRDFTINALYLDAEGKITDFHHGLADLKNHTLKMIGDANIRLREDPLRIIRAIRFKVVLNFTWDDALKAAIINHGSLVKNISLSKLKQEWEKIKKYQKENEFIQVCQELNLAELLNLIYKKLK